MALDKFRIIGWLFVAALASGLSMIFAGKVLHMPLAIVHKLRGRGRIRWEKKLRIWGDLFTVVGAVKNTKHLVMNERPGPMVYMNYYQNSDWELIVQAKTRSKPAYLASLMERTIKPVPPSRCRECR